VILFYFNYGPVIYANARDGRIGALADESRATIMRRTGAQIEATPAPADAGGGGEEEEAAAGVGGGGGAGARGGAPKLEGPSLHACLTAAGATARARVVPRGVVAYAVYRLLLTPQVRVRAVHDCGLVRLCRGGVCSRCVPARCSLLCSVVGARLHVRGR
jgi:hypothetical protein